MRKGNDLIILVSLASLAVLIAVFIPYAEDATTETVLAFVLSIQTVLMLTILASAIYSGRTDDRMMDAMEEMREVQNLCLDAIYAKNNGGTGMRYPPMQSDDDRRLRI